MSRTAVLNIILGAIASSLVTILVVLETTETSAPTTTTTTVPATTTTTTTTTTSTLPATSTTTTTTTTTSTLPPDDGPPVERFFVAVVVVNGTTAGERLAPAQQRLQDAGYFSVRGMSGVVPSQETRIYALDETFVQEARTVAADLGFDPDEVAIGLFEDAPPVAGLLDAKVIVYLGPEPLPDLPPADDAEGDGGDG